MRSNYKKIGKYVKQVNNRNKDLSVINLKGININKKFMPSVANTQGTDLSKYKIVSYKQFAFNPMHVGRDEVLPISMLASDKPVIVSPAYVVFKVDEQNELLPEYLMMWCRRPEFDRNAWFTTDSSVRGGFSWNDFCSLELPVPYIEKQREIVKEYNTIVNRIKLNEELNKKLEETAQAIYKHWFVDFEFPISKEYAEAIGKPEFEGKPYKSNGGKMTWNDELDQDIPEGWISKELGYLININSNNYNSKQDDFITIEYLDTGSITSNRIEMLQTLVVGQESIPSRAKRKVVHNDIVYSTVRPNLRHFGLIKNPPKNMLVSTGFAVIRSAKKEISNELILCWISNEKTIDYFQSKAEMSVSTYPSIKPEDVESLIVSVPEEDQLKYLNDLLSTLFERLYINQGEILILNQLSSILHQKMTKANT